MAVERLTNFSGGMNVFDAPEDLAKNQARLLKNVRLLPTGAAKKRLGHESQLGSPLTGGTSGVRGLHRFYFGSSIQTLVFHHTTLTALDTSWNTVASQGMFTAGSWFDFVTWRAKVFATTPNHSLFAYDGAAFTNLTATHSAPDKAKCVATYMERLWLGKGSELYFSDLGDETSWDTGNDFFYIGEDDGSDIERLAVPFGQYLMIFKDMSVWMLYGEDPDTFGVRPLFENLGIAAPGTLAITDNIALWVSHRGVHLFDGERLRDISEPIQPLIESALLSPSKRRLMAGGLNGFYYWLSFASENSSVNDTTLVYDIRRNAWVEDSRAFQTYASAEGPEDDGKMYAGDVSAGQVYKLDTGTDDNGSDIAWTLTTRTVDFGDRHIIKQLQRIRREGPIPAGASVTVSYDIDGTTGNAATQNQSVPATSKGQLASFALTATDSLDWSDYPIRGVIAEADPERSALIG